jgi:hypothetical protein
MVLQAYKATQTAPRLQRQKDPSGRSVSNCASEDFLGKPAPRLSRVGVRFEVRVRAATVRLDDNKPTVL